jgi:hypothetical protein
MTRTTITTIQGAAGTPTAPWMRAEPTPGGIR